MNDCKHFFNSSLDKDLKIVMKCVFCNYTLPDEDEYEDDLKGIGAGLRTLKTKCQGFCPVCGVHEQ